MQRKRIDNIPEHVSEVLKALQEAGHEAYLVGGCVRDAVLGLRPEDWDIATDALVSEIKSVFPSHVRNFGGERHGTVIVISGGNNVEVTTFRSDGTYSDARRPDEVKFVKSLREDVARRDFTMNALAAEASGKIIDFFGGMDDIKKGLVRCVGEPVERFSEDGLRILRALRFSSVLGFEIEAQTREAIYMQKEILNLISRERLYEETDKLLCGENVRKVLCEYSNVFSVFIPEIEPMIGFKQRNKHHIFDVWEHTTKVVENVPPEPVLRWAALFHDIGKPHTFSLGEDGEGHFYGHAAKGVEIAKLVMRRLRFSSADIAEVTQLIRYHDTPLTPEKKRIKRMLANIGVDSFYRLLALARADNSAQASEYSYRQEIYKEVEALAEEILKAEECFSLKDLAVSGYDLVAAGYEGKEVGQALKSLLSDVLDGILENDREVLLERIYAMHKKENI